MEQLSKEQEEVYEDALKSYRKISSEIADLFLEKPEMAAILVRQLFIMAAGVVYRDGGDKLINLGLEQAKVLSEDFEKKHKHVCPDCVDKK